MTRAPLPSVAGGYRLPMSGHQHENEHALEDEERRPDDAEGHEGSDQDSEPSLNAPGDAAPSGVVADDPEEEQS